MKREHTTSRVCEKGRKMFEIKEISKIKTGLNKKYYERTLEKIKDITPLAKIAALNLIGFINENCKEIGVSVVSDGYRNAVQQNMLYKKGRELPGKIVTNCDGYKKLSKHQSGNAFDIAIIKNEKADYTINTWKKVIFEIKKFKILFEIKYPKYEMILGAEWQRFKDMPHVEIRKRKEVK